MRIEGGVSKCLPAGATLSIAGPTGDWRPAPSGDNLGAMLRAMSLLVALLMAVGGCAPPTPVSAQHEAQVDSVRLMRDLSVLAHDSMAGRATGSPGAERARAFLTSSLREAGVAPVGDDFARAFRWPRGTGENLVAIVPGRELAGHDMIFITAHYDHLGIRDGEVFNGADDNASGTAVLLEVARQLRGEPLRHTAVIVFFDAEEAGLQGSRALVLDPPVSLDSVALEVNLDMVARTGGVLWAAGAYHTPALEPVLLELAASAPLDLRLGHDRPGSPEDDWTDSSDHAAFHHVGIPFVYFGVEDHPDYHRESDELDRIDAGELMASARTILAGIRLLDAALPLDGAVPR